MGINYNKIEYLELLKKKSVIGHSEDYIKLLEYSTITNAYLDWCIREHYLDLLENFRKGKMKPFEFCISFENTGLLTSDIIHLLESNFIILSPNEKLLGFSDLIEEAFSHCKSYLQDVEFRDKDDEVEFKNFVEEFYLKFQEILKEDRTTLKDSTDLSELVDQLSWENKDQYFKLIEEFLDESSNFLNFKKKYESLVKVAKELESNSNFLEPSYQALGFSNFIHILIQLFDRYQMDPEISPKVFKSWVRKILLEMKNHYS